MGVPTIFGLMTRQTRRLRRELLIPFMGIVAGGAGERLLTLLRAGAER